MACVTLGRQAKETGQTVIELAQEAVDALPEENLDAPLTCSRCKDIRSFGKDGFTMSRSNRLYPSGFRRRMVELVHAGRSPNGSGQTNPLLRKVSGEGRLQMMITVQSNGTQLG